MSPDVITNLRLESQALTSLATGNIIAIRVPHFYPKAMCADIASRMTMSSLYGKYANAPQIGRVGQAFFESLVSEEHRRMYECNALGWINEMRACCEPYLSPIDKLRLSIDELWPGGSQLGILSGKKMFVGLARIFGSGASAEPHQDVLAWDAPDAEEARGLCGQLAANIYLKMPREGGELLIWPRSLSYDEYQSMRIPGSYGVHAAALGCDPVRIRPQEGELILFNSTLVHAVAKSEAGDRITWSCFIGLRGLNQPVIMWS